MANRGVGLQRGRGGKRFIGKVLASKGINYLFGNFFSKVFQEGFWTIFNFSKWGKICFCGFKPKKIS